MTFRQFFFIPVFIAVLATTLVMLAKPSPLVIPFVWTWISFQAWAMYFLGGCTVKGGVKVMLGYFGGAAASVAIFELMALLMAPVGLGAAAALAIAVFIVVIGVISAERLPGFDFVPSWFIGAGVFFGVMSIHTGWEWTSDCPRTQQWLHYLEAGTYLMVSCFVGQIYGWVTVLIRGKYEGWIKSKHPELGAAERE
ncbi:MAG TPA: DUF1097 domain-containing protein [Phycisphaerae bacterium]|nr:DUF1097 domain-containing protein [Phycisphaerae bacterium]